MFVVIGPGHIHLADRGQVAAPADVGEEPDLQAPVVGDAQGGGHRRVHGRLPGQRVAEGAEVAQVSAVADHGPQRLQQRPHQQPGHPPPQAAIGDPGVEALGVAVPERRVGHRIGEPGQQRPVVADDVGVVQGHHLGPAPSQDRPQAVPDVAALARPGRGQPFGGEALMHPAHGGPVVPDEVVVLGQAVEEPAGAPVAVLVGFVQPHQHVVEPVGASQLRHHGVEGGRADLRVQAGDDQGDGPLRGPGPQVGLEVLGGPVPEIVQGGHDPGLAEVRHGPQSRTTRRRFNR